MRRWVVPVVGAGLWVLLVCSGEGMVAARGHRAQGRASGHRRGRRREAAGPLRRPRLRHPPDPPRSGRAPGEGGGGGRIDDGGLGPGRLRPDRVLRHRALEADAGQGAGPDLRRGGHLDRDPLGQGVGLHPQRRRLCRDEQPRDRGGDPDRGGPLSERAERPGPAADRERRDRGPEPVRRPRLAEAPSPERLETRPRRPG